MKVLHILGVFQHGGIERFLLDFVIASKAHGISSRVLSVMDRSHGPLVSAFEKEGVEIYRCHLRKRAVARRVVQEAASGVDIVHSHLGVLSGDPFRWLRFSGSRARLIAHEHTLVRSPLRYRAYELLSHRWTLRYADALAAVSTATKRRLVGRSGRDCALIPPGIPLQQWRSGGRQAPAAPPWRLLMVARLDPVKNHLFALDVAEELMQRGFCFRLDCLGDGPLKDLLIDEVERRGLSGSVTLHGAVDNVVEWMQSAHLLLLPSKSEGAGRVLFEAAALGLPFFVSDTVDVSDFFPNARQLPLVPKAWADAIQAENDYVCPAAAVDLSIERCVRDSMLLYRNHHAT